MAEVTSVENKKIETAFNNGHKKEIDGGKIFTIFANNSLKASIGESRAIDGVCTTITEIPKKNYFKFYASAETLAITTLGSLKNGMLVNLELPLSMGATLDGHIVSGHVDKTSILTKKIVGQSHILRFAINKPDLPYLIEKGSVTIAGISLTVYKIINSQAEHAFEVMIIPHTYKNTTLQFLKPGSHANIEFDMMGKYAIRYAMLSSQ